MYVCYLYTKALCLLMYPASCVLVIYNNTIIVNTIVYGFVAASITVHQFYIANCIWPLGTHLCVDLCFADEMSDSLAKLWIM